MKGLLSFKGIALAMVSSLVLVGTLVGGGVALAANDSVVMDTAPGTPGPFAQLQTEVLENLYQREQLAVQELQLRLDLANKVSDAAQSWITTLKGQGKDTSALDSALSAFKAKIATAKSEYDQAVSTLSTHNGFNGGGKVTDAQQAKQTLQTVRDHLKAARQAMRDGTHTLRQAIRDYRQQNRPNPGSSSTAPQGQSS